MEVTNRILDVWAESRSLDPMQAEVWLTVRPEQLTPGTELRGRLMGPTCPFSSTVEIAYPLTPLPQPPPPAGTLRYRVIIPEASLWEPARPFLYAGPVELWQDGRRCDRVQVRHGLRKISLGAGGLRVNGRPLTLNGAQVDRLDEVTARELRQRSTNLLLTPLREDTRAVWDEAERLGFLVLGRVEADATSSEEWMRRLERRASSLGWVFTPEDLKREWPAVGQEMLIASEGDSQPDSAHIQIRRVGDYLEFFAGNLSLGRQNP